MVVIGNNPFDNILKVINYLYPNLDCVLSFNPIMEECGSTTFPYDGSMPIVDINTPLSINDSLDIIAHEIAHVVAGINVEHGVEWRKEFEKIHTGYMELFKE
jgi:hypothetical protein